MKVIVNVDYQEGFVLPDGKVLQWAKDKIDEANDLSEPLKLDVGSNLQVVAFQYWVRELGLPGGAIELQYENQKDVIDSDGNLGIVAEGSQVLEKMLMRLF